MSNLSAAAAALGAPEALVRRSAEARSKATGASVEDILGAWAGGVTPTASTPAAPSAPVPTEASPTPTPPAPSVAAAAPVTATPVAPAVVTRPPTPASVNPQEALAFPVVVTVPTAGLRERTGSTLPGWLAAVLLLIPTIGLLYFGTTASAGGCVEGGFELAVDRVTGLVENCDGSEYAGKGGAGGGAGQFLTAGADTYVQCAACHGATGAGAGAFPALTGVNTVFASCADHIEWVTLGTAGFQDAGRATYGDTGKPVGGSGAAMPGFGASLTPEQLASVVAYERITFGGGDPDTVLVDCGLVEGETTATTAPVTEARAGRNG